MGTARPHFTKAVAQEATSRLEKQVSHDVFRQSLRENVHELLEDRLIGSGK